VSAPPADPKIYHITHVDNLTGIVRDGALWSDAKRIELGIDTTLVGMSRIKQRRLDSLEVKCHPGVLVGECVPFYFCPRAIMLYMLHMSNHPELSYRGGQGPIIHLQADLTATVRWADAQGVPWAFTDRNAAARAASFYRRTEDLGQLNWEAIAATDWRDMVVREQKQAEFLVRDSFPWTLVERIGVQIEHTARRAHELLGTVASRPVVSVERDWYY
jgi:hypothetical protein